MLQLQDPQAQVTRRYLLDHCAQILGPFTAHRWVLDATWMGGWIIALALPSEPHGNDVPWSSVARLPACACLRSLRGSHEAVRDALPHCRATLRSLIVEDRVEPITMHALLDTLPDGTLEHFGFQIPWFGKAEDFRALLEHTALRSLRGIALTREIKPFGDGLFSGPLLEALLEAPLLHRLELRDFSGLQVAEPQELVDAFASAPGRTLMWDPSATRP